jgi:putative flippase GtrA
MSRACGSQVARRSGEQFVRFLLVGLSNFAISFLTFHSLLQLPEGLRPTIFLAQLLSYSVGTVWSFVWNKRYTFRSSGRPMREAARFVGLQCSLALVSAVTIELMVNPVGLKPAIAWILVMTGVTVANYFLSRYWAFRA